WAFVGACGEGYVLYGGAHPESAPLRRAKCRRMRWVGGAHAYHQWHPVSSPPVEHLDDILTNATRFHSIWGFWPMEGWLEAFADRGLATYRDGKWVRA